MKLVDILARELKEWPEGVVTAVQDKDCEVKFDNSTEPPCLNSSGDAWVRQGDYGDNLALQMGASDYRTAIITYDQWRPAVDALECEPVPEWVGIGRPPAGAICEFLDLRGGVKRDWVKVCVRYISDVMLVVKPDHPIDCQYEIALHPDTAQFRVLRTPEQIAAEERETELNRMVATVSMLDKSWARKVCAGLYDAGYRKFETINELKS